MSRQAFLSCSGLAAVALLTLFAPPACTQPATAGEIKKQVKELKKLFPEFESRKSGIGSLALIADVVVVEDVPGRTENVFREDSKEIGRGLLDSLALSLANKGYSFSSERLVSVGSVINDKTQYRVLDRWDQRTEELSRFPVESPPVYQDSTLCTSDSIRAAWHELLDGVWAFKKKKNQPAGTLPSVTNLRETIGTDFAMVVVVVATRATMGKLLKGNALKDLPIFGKKTAFKLSFDSWEDVHFDKDVDFDKYSGLGLKLAIVNCRDGEVLWSDGDHDRWGLEGTKLDILTRDVIRRMI